MDISGPKQGPRKAFSDAPCSGSMTFWCGSGSGTFEGTFTSFFKDKKSKKKSQNSRNQGMSYYFLLDVGRIWIRIHTSG